MVFVSFARASTPNGPRVKTGREEEISYILYYILYSIIYMYIYIYTYIHTYVDIHVLASTESHPLTSCQ